MTTDHANIHTAIASLAAASHALAPLERSPALSPEARGRIQQLIGRIGLEADVLRGGDDRGLVGSSLTEEHRAQFYRESFPHVEALQLPLATGATTTSMGGGCP